MTLKLKGGLYLDHIYNGVGYGNVAQRLLHCNGNYGVLRPYLDEDEQGNLRSWIVNEEGEAVVSNAPAVLPKQAWIQLDNTVARVQRDELRVFEEIRGMGLNMNLPNALATTVLQEQTMTDFGVAGVSMSGLRRTERDRPEYDLRNFPIPIIHGEFSWDLRTLEQSRVRSGGANFALDTTSAEMITRRMSELIEEMAIGTAATFSYGGGSIYGLINKPERVTKAFTLPTAVGWTPDVLVDEILDAIDSLQTLNFNGPYGIYYSPAWWKYLGQDYSGAYARTVMSRLQEIDPEKTDIRWWRRARYLKTEAAPFQIVIFQLTQDVIRTITGMPMTTLQWSEQGGLELCWKIICILLTQLRATADDTTGIAHCVAA